MEPKVSEKGWGGGGESKGYCRGFWRILPSSLWRLREIHDYSATLWLRKVTLTLEHHMQVASTHTTQASRKGLEKRSEGRDHNIGLKT